jgi:transposase
VDGSAGRFPVLAGGLYDFFRRWRAYDYARELYERLRRSARQRAGRNAEPSAGVIDSQSVDASETVGEDSRGYDGGKSRDGRKRHILTDTDGLLLEVTVTTADVHHSSHAEVQCRPCYWRVHVWLSQALHSHRTTTVPLVPPKTVTHFCD